MSGSRFRRLCSREFLNWQRVLECFDLVQQLRDQAREEGMRLGARQAGYETLHQALLSGLLSHVGSKHPEDPGHQGARGRGFLVFPRSGLFGRNPRWIMAAEIVETSRPWGRIAAEIAPEWIERTGAHLLRRHALAPRSISSLGPWRARRWPASSAVRPVCELVASAWTTSSTGC